MSEPRNRIVLRYERVTYQGIGGIEAHGKRLGDTKHVDASRTALNEFPIGHADLRDIVDAHIVQMQRDNADMRRASLKRRRRKTDIEDLDAAIQAAGDDPHALAEVVGWPWDPKNVHPFTEGILSVSHEWFLDAKGEVAQAKIDMFRDFAVGYVQSEFGGEVLYARLDLDEKTPHLSFLVAPEHEENRTKRRMLSHRQHRLFGLEEVTTLFTDSLGEAAEDDQVRRRSYEILQDRVAEFAQAQGLDIVRGEQRAQDERLKRELGEDVIKRSNVTPSRGREHAAVMMGEAEEKKLEAEAELSAAKLERAKAAEAAAAAVAEREAAARASSEAQADREAAASARRSAEATESAARKSLRDARELREALAAREESIRIGSQAIILRELTYAPPTPERTEALTWGANRPESRERRAWLTEKIQPARDWLIGFARTLFGYEAQKQAEDAAQKARAQAILDAEERHGRRPPQTMLDIVKGAPLPAGEIMELPGAWSVPATMTTEQIDAKLAGMTNTALCDAYAPTRDSMHFAEHDGARKSGYSTALHHLAREATWRGLDLDMREHRPDKATDAERARLHKDSPPRPLRVLRLNSDRVRTL